MAKVKAIKERNERALFQVPGVVGVGVGIGPAIEVHISQDSEEARRQIPRKLDGVPVRVVVTGEIQAR
ncbi:MAG: hypothetical protein Q8Q15_03530 [bacterium]|nr:hypothetical protein [bacterium]